MTGWKPESCGNVGFHGVAVKLCHISLASLGWVDGELVMNCFGASEILARHAC